MHFDICCIGHITLDKIVTPKDTVFMPGGTAFYFSHAIKNMGAGYLLVTALAANEMDAVTELCNDGISVIVLPSANTVFFENIYGHNPDERTQRVLQKADAFTAAQLTGIEATIFHLGPLLADDMTAELVRSLAAKGKVSLDVQGFLRKVENQNVCAIDWPDKKDVLSAIHFLKANEDEMKVLTGEPDLQKGAKALAAWGVKEVILSLGSKGSVVYSNNRFYPVPAFVPEKAIDATGCGDTYMAGYLYQRFKGEGIQQTGEFAAAMATLKIQTSGPFTGTEDEVREVQKNNQRQFPDIA